MACGRRVSSSVLQVAVDSLRTPPHSPGWRPIVKNFTVKLVAPTPVGLPVNRKNHAYW